MNNIYRIIEEKGLPCNLDAERAVLGSVLLGDLSMPDALAVLSAGDFSLENHQRIFAVMESLHSRVESINAVTVANELLTRGVLEPYPISYLCSLTDHLPKLLNVGSYLRIVKDKSIGRQGIALCSHLINELASQIEHAPEMLRRAELLIRDIGGQAVQRHNMQSPAQIIEEAGGAAQFLEPQSSIGVETPWPTLNKLTLGLQRGDLSLLGGRPSTGKTTAALQIVNHAIANNVGTMLFSLETPAKTLLRRLACMSINIDYQRWRWGALEATDRAKLFRETERLREVSRLFISERALATVSSIHADLRRTKCEQEIGLIVIDYLQLMHSTGKHQTRVSEVSEISRDLKLAAVEFQIPFLVLSQLNRAPETENRAPQLSDLRESGSLEQDADLVIFLSRPRSEGAANYHTTATEMIVAKQRNGPIGAFPTLFMKRLARLEEAAAESAASV